MYTGTYIARVRKLRRTWECLCLFLIEFNLTKFFLDVLSISSFSDPERQHDRAIAKTALAEYYEKHGGAPHH